MIHAYLAAFIGGLFIGFAAFLLWVFNGRIMGASGIFGSLLGKISPSERQWRSAFVLGMVTCSALLFYFSGFSQWFETEIHTPPIALVIAGLAVGFGTQLGGGCTSGHGICGVSRLSKRSISATLIFMITGFVTVALVRGYFGIW